MNTPPEDVCKKHGEPLVPYSFRVFGRKFTKKHCPKCDAEVRERLCRT